MSSIDAIRQTLIESTNSLMRQHGMELRMEAQRVPAEQDNAGDDAEYLRRYKHAMYKMDNPASSTRLAQQICDAIDHAKSAEMMAMFTAFKDRDEAEIGRVMLKILDLWKHSEADAEAMV